MILKMSKDVDQIKTWLNKQKGKRSQIIEDIDILEVSIKRNERSLIRHTEAAELIKLAGLKTQEQLQYHISDITSMAMEAVFPDPYDIRVEFIQRRNKTECDIFFVRDEQKVDPLSSSGGGAIDVATLALRVACWSMNIPHTRNVIVLDEPLKNLDKKKQELGSQIIKEISQKLGIQFIIVTHEEVLASYADKTFEVTKNKKRGISKVVEL
jgi:DNA repair exonuclease SbcCD ATPase subunit